MSGARDPRDLDFPRLDTPTSAQPSRPESGTAAGPVVVRLPSGEVAGHPWQALRSTLPLPAISITDEAKALALLSDERLNLFGDETGSILRAISPMQAFEDRLRYELDERYATTLVVRRWPREGMRPSAWYGFLSGLPNAVPDLALSLHNWRIGTGPAVRELRTQVEKLTIERRELAAKMGEVDPKVNDLDAELERLEGNLRAVSMRAETIFHQSCYIRVTADREELLDERVAAVEEWARTVGITLMRATADQRDAYVSSMPFAADPAYYTRVTGTERAAAAMPLISRPHIERNTTGKKPVALYGIHMTDHTPVFMSPWNTNETIDITTVLGAPGSGKSYWCRTHIGRLAMAGVRTITIDPIGDFVLWHQKNGGTVIEIGPGSPVHINPLRRTKGVEVDDDGTEYAGIERIDDAIARLSALFSLILNEDYDIVAEGLIETGLRTFYERYGEQEKLMEDFINVLKEVTTTAVGDLSDATARRRANLVDILALRCLSGAYKELFAYPTNVAVDPDDDRSQKICFSLNAIKDNAALLPFGVYLAITMARDIAKQSLKPKLLLIDELHRVFAAQKTAAGVSQMLIDLNRTHRHYNAALTYSTQLFDKSDEADRNRSQETILALTKSWVLLRATASMLEQTASICADADPELLERVLRVVGEVKGSRGQPTPMIVYRSGEPVPMWSVGLSFEDAEDDRASGVNLVRDLDR
jgi:hypothetical protein